MSVIAAVDKCSEHRHHPSSGVSFASSCFLYKDCSRQHFITATSLLSAPGRRCSQWFEMALCPFAIREDWSEVFGFVFWLFLLFFLPNKQPCFWIAGSNVPLCTRRATKLKQHQWTAVCQVCEDIYFCIIIFHCCWLGALTPRTFAILESVNSKRQKKTKKQTPSNSDLFHCAYLDYSCGRRFINDLLKLMRYQL